MVQNVVQRTVHRVHAEGSLLLASLHNSLPMHFRISEIRDRTYFIPGLARFGPWDMDDKPEATVQQLHETVDMLIHHAVFSRTWGSMEFTYIWDMGAPFSAPHCLLS